MEKLEALGKWVVKIAKDYWAVISLILVLIALFFFGGYLVFGHWHWTGFFRYTTTDQVTNTTVLRPDKTLWDWMELVIVPLVIAGGLYLLNRAERDRERNRQVTEREREAKRIKQREKEAANRLKEEVLQSYFDRMTELLRNELSDPNPDDKIRVVVRTLTLTTLQQLDSKRKRILLEFLREAGLIKADFDTSPIANLKRADLSGTDLSEAFLERADLSGVDLSRADLSRAGLMGVNLHEADLSGADLSGADLYQTYLKGARIDDETRLDEKWRLVWELVNQKNEGRNLAGADLRKAFLAGAVLTGANLSEADLSETALSGADLSGADLNKANLSRSFLDRANLSGADLSEANLCKTYLLGAKYDNETIWPKEFDPEAAGVIKVLK